MTRAGHIEVTMSVERLEHAYGVIAQVDQGYTTSG
jgi:hypothetical protein